MISIIIPTYNEEKNIERCLKSLENQTVPRNEFEVIVVDGQSKDRTADFAKKYADKVIQQKSKSVGGARNDGANISKGEIIATTDADCVLSKNWIELIKKNFKRKNVVGIYGPLKPIDVGMKLKEKTNDKTAYIKLKIMIEKIKLNTAFMIEEIFMQISPKLGYHPIWGANCAFDRKAFLEIGGYSDLPVIDDCEIGVRIKSFGRIVFDKNMKVGYSVRRIEKVGLINFTTFLGFNVIRLLLGKKIKGRYAKEEY